MAKSKGAARNKTSGKLPSKQEILDFLEEATDRCEDVANLLEGVVVKNA